MLLWLITGCVNEDFSDCPQGSFQVAFEYVHHTDNTCPDRFNIDVQQIDLYVFDAAGCFLKCITRKGTPFPKDFRVDPELSAGSYTLVAWGNLTDEVTLQPVFIAGQTTLEQALLSLNATEERSVNYRLTPVFHAMKQVEVNDVKEHTEVLSLIKNEVKQPKGSNVDLGDMGFVGRFRVRQMLREMRTGLTIVIGMFIALICLMLSLNTATFCSKVKKQNVEDTHYEYMYTYKYPTENPPEGGEAAYAKTLKKEVYGYNWDVTVLGLSKNTKYFDVDLKDGKNRVAISSSTNKIFFMFLLHNIPLNHFLSHTYCKCKHPPNSEYIIHIKILVFFRLQNAPQFHSLCIFLK